MGRHVILVGLPGAGKTTVGRLIARRLGLGVVDIDEIIERNEGASIREIIETRGEQEFRRLEALETKRVLAGLPAVVVPGGGWAAQEGNLETVCGSALTVYLETSPEVAARRVAAFDNRPLLDSQDPRRRMAELFASRKAYYQKCDTSVTTDGKAVEEIAAEVVELALGDFAG